MMMIIPGTLIREFNIHTDQSDVKRILEKAFNTTVSFDNYTDNKTVYVLEVDNKIVATATLVIVNKFIHNGSRMGLIEDVATDESTRGKGYASLLIKELIEISKLFDCYKVILNCDDSLLPFYEKNGFMKSGSLMRINL